jgi:hypothetical protein
METICNCGEWIMRSLREIVISTAVLNDLQAEFGTAPATEESFCKVQNAAQLLFIYCLPSESRNAGFSGYNVMPFPENCCSTSLFVKDSLKEVGGLVGG